MKNFELVKCAPGDHWFPHNYGNDEDGKLVGTKVMKDEPGLTVLNAKGHDGEILGSCCFRVGDRHSKHILADEEYQYGAMNAGPAYFWPDDNQRIPWIVTLKSIWVKPEARRAGVARTFVEAVREIGLPTYASFASSCLQEWFERDFKPSSTTSKLQEMVKQMYGHKDGDGKHLFNIYVHAEAKAMDLWWVGQEDAEHQDEISISENLFFPSRISEEDADAEMHELHFSDSAFADDRAFGYYLMPDTVEWGALEGPDCNGDLENDGFALEEYEKKSCFLSGEVKVLVTDPDALKIYATVRNFLRTYEWKAFDDIEEAANELFVRDLTENPKDLLQFHTMISVNEDERDFDCPATESQKCSSELPAKATSEHSLAAA